MKDTFLYSDPHLGHKGVTVFLNKDGSPLRPWDDVDEMDEELVKRYNECVSPTSKVYFLGDCVINRKALKTLGRLNGDKVLIKGNHDIWQLKELTPYFRDIRAYHVMQGLIMSHIPVHEDSLARFRKNIHGHLHGNRVMLPESIDSTTGKTIYSKTKIDPRYFSVCVEQTDFRPIAFEEALKRMKQEEEESGFVDSRPSVLGPG